jgi:peptidoglycan/xylan/chitin deacetylase (PgdA/CDA1 family)
MENNGNRISVRRISEALFSVLGAIGRIHPPNWIPVLLYHSIDSSGSVISITPKLFRAQMLWLKRNGYQTLSLPEYVECLTSSNKSPHKSVVITFDDGFKNNYTIGLPVLCKFGFTATIFLATDHIGGLCCWRGHESIPQIPMLSWEEILKMCDKGIDFGSHTCSHAFLTRLTRKELLAELRNSRHLMEEKLRRKVRFFSHPYGETNRETQRALKQCGYKGGFGRLDFSHGNTAENLFDMTRIGTAHFSSVQAFQAGLLGTYAWYIRLKLAIFAALNRLDRDAARVNTRMKYRHLFR